LTVSADIKTLATVQQKSSQNLYFLPGQGQNSEVKPFAPEGIKVGNFNWTRDGNLLVSDGARLVRMSPDGTNQTQLLADPSGGIFDPASCGSDHLVFAWAFHGGSNSVRLWHSGADGSNPVEVTKGRVDQRPICSPDEKTLYYLNVTSNNPVSSVKLDGSGKEATVSGSVVPDAFVLSNNIVLSTDGKTLVYVVEVVNAATQNGHEKIALLDLGSSAPRLLEADQRIAPGGIQFTPDGKGVAYPIREKGVDNIWIQPLDGGPGHQITNFTSDQISLFHWSPDGKTLGILRGHSESDVVLLQENKP
jgi:Tol biopolymer transport system component